MRDPERIDVFCDVLKGLWHEVPDWRFGQLMLNALGEVYNRSKQDPFYIEDEKMLEELRIIFETKFGKS